MPDLERLRRGMRLLSAALTEFAEATTDHQRLFELIARRVVETIGDTCSVMLLHPDGSMRGQAWDAADPAVRAALAEFLSLPVAAGDRSTVHEAANGTHAFLPHMDLDALGDRIAPRNLAFLRAIGARGMITVGMRARGQTVGAIAMIRVDPARAPYDELDLEVAQDLANHAALAIVNARLVEALRDADEVRRSRQQALEANRFLDAMIEQIPDMVFVKDAHRLAFTRFNRAGEELIGLPREALLGKTDHDLFPPAEAAFFQKKDRETLAGKVMVEIAEEPIQTLRGLRWLHTKKVPILDDDGTPLFLLGISQDITERKHAETALREARDQAEAANRELEAFSYSVAHDLRTPLRGIDGFSQALLEDYGQALDETGQRYLSRVREAAQRMALLIDDLLALSRVTRAELHKEHLDLTEMAHAAIGRLQRGEPARQVAIDIAPGLEVDADPRVLAVVLDNLLGNAWKFTAKTASPRIELGRRGHELYVRDNGAGFDPTYAHKLFGVFQRLHTEVEFPGTGIGLATVARIIHRHGGRVRAEGAVGAGATFYFTLGDHGNHE